MGATGPRAIVADDHTKQKVERGWNRNQVD